MTPETPPPQPGFLQAFMKGKFININKLASTITIPLHKINTKFNLEKGTLIQNRQLFSPGNGTRVLHTEVLSI